MLNEATKRKSPNALSFGETQREFGDTAMVKPHLAITHTRELLGKSAKAELVKIYGGKHRSLQIQHITSDDMVLRSPLFPVRDHSRRRERSCQDQRK